MAKMSTGEPQSANDYDDRTTAAVKSVLIEIGQILGSYKGKFAVIGGAVPWLLLNQVEDMRHVGTLDVDLSLDAEALGDGEYARLIESLMTHGYEKREYLKRFQLVRRIEVEDEGPPVDVIVDFLMPKDAVIDKNKPPIIDDFAVQRANGADRVRTGISLAWSARPIRMTSAPWLGEARARRMTAPPTSSAR